MDKIKLLNLAQLLIMRADVVDIMNREELCYQDAEKVKLMLINMLHEMEQREKLLGSTVGEVLQ